jgi:hypothetical protein
MAAVTAPARVSVQQSWTPSRCVPRARSRCPGAAHKRQGVGAQPAETGLAHDHITTIDCDFLTQSN